jgi:beta-galactosidase
VARIGALLDLVQPDAEQMPVDWLGRGPAESYADSARAALRGRAVTPSRTG